MIEFAKAASSFFLRADVFTQPGSFRSASPQSADVGSRRPARRLRATALNRFAIVAAVCRPERCPQGRVRWRAIAVPCLVDLSLNLLEHGAARMIGHRTIRNFTPKIPG